MNLEGRIVVEEEVAPRANAIWENQPRPIQLNVEASNSLLSILSHIIDDAGGINTLATIRLKDESLDVGSAEYGFCRAIECLASRIERYGDFLLDEILHHEGREQAE